jgi:hypothetical protein
MEVQELEELYKLKLRIAWEEYKHHVMKHIRTRYDSHEATQG